MLRIFLRSLLLSEGVHWESDGEQMYFLDAGGTFRRYAEVNVVGAEQGSHLAALLAGECDHGDAASMGHVYRFDHVG